MNTIHQGRRRIDESQYQADIAAAEARGRASVVSPIASSTTQPSPAPISQHTSEAARIAALDSLPFASEFPEVIAQAKKDGLSTMEASVKMVEALRATSQTTASGGSPVDMGDKLEARVAKAKVEGRTIGLAQAAAELASETQNDTARLAAQLEDRVTKAKGEGRKISLAQAAAELAADGLI